MNDLLAALTRDAEAEAEKLRQAAEREAVDLLKQAAGARAASLDAEVEQTRRVRQRQADAEVASAALEARRLRLQARAAMLERARQAVKSRLPSRLDRAELIEGLVAAALDAAAGQAVAVRCPAAIVDRVRRHAGSLPVSADPECGSGVRVELARERGEVDATLESLFDTAWPELQIAALKLAEEQT